MHTALKAKVIIILILSFHVGLAALILHPVFYYVGMFVLLHVRRNERTYAMDIEVVCTQAVV